MDLLTHPPVLAWLRTATPQLVERAQRAPMRFAAIPSRAAWLRDLRLQLLEHHVRGDGTAEKDGEAPVITYSPTT